MPRVSRLSIAAVRSLGLEHPDEIAITQHGVVEDRRFYLIDAGGRLVSRLVIGELVQIATHTDPEGRRLRMAFPDGTVVEDEVSLAEPVRTAIYSRTAIGHVVVGPWAEPLSAFCGREIRLVRCDAPAGTRAGNPASIITEGSLRALAMHAGVPEVDGRRFRMLIELDGGEAHEEDTWIGHDVAVGGAVLRVTKPDARCAITTQDPDTGVRDLDTLRTLIAYRGLRNGKNADFGVLADVVAPGRVRIGDEVAVT